MTVDCWYRLAGIAFVHAMSKNLVVLLFKDSADLRMESFSCKQSLHTLSRGANGFTFLTIFHLIFKSMCFAF